MMIKKNDTLFRRSGIYMMIESILPIVFEP